MVPGGPNDVAQQAGYIGLQPAPCQLHVQS
jgi:hypothetical protein